MAWNCFILSRGRPSRSCFGDFPDGVVPPPNKDIPPDDNAFRLTSPTPGEYSLAAYKSPPEARYRLVQGAGEENPRHNP
jgi:hypothetical protein